MLIIENKQKFETIVSEAIIATATNARNERSVARWIRAIEKAAELVETQSEFITWNEAEKAVLILNVETNGIYEANGSCQCQAYLQGMPCKHRALAKLLKTYFAPASQPKAAGIEKAAYLKPASQAAPVQVGRFRI
jgi:hypothetical protein